MENDHLIGSMDDIMLYNVSNADQSFQILCGVPVVNKLLRFRERGNSSYLLATNKSIGHPLLFALQHQQIAVGSVVVMRTKREERAFDFSDPKNGMLIIGFEFY